MILSYDDVKALAKPHEILNDAHWNNIRDTLMSKAGDGRHPKLFYALTQPINVVASYLGIYWKEGEYHPMYKLLFTPISDTFRKQHMRSWKKNAITLTAIRLCEVDEEGLTLLIDAAQNYFNKQQHGIVNTFTEAFSAINGSLSKEIITNLTIENWKDPFNTLVKKTIKHLFPLCEFQTKNINMYIRIIWARFFELKPFNEIAEEFNVYNPQIYAITKRFIGVFKSMLNANNQFPLKVAYSWDRYYNKCFDILTDDITPLLTKMSIEQYGLTPKGKVRAFHSSALFNGRNNKLEVLNVFRDHFIASYDDFNKLLIDAEYERARTKSTNVTEGTTNA